MTSPLVPQSQLKVRTDILKVPFHRASVGEDEIHAVSEVIRSGWTKSPASADQIQHHIN